MKKITTIYDLEKDKLYMWIDAFGSCIRVTTGAQIQWNVPPICAFDFSENWTGDGLKITNRATKNYILIKELGKILSEIKNFIDSKPEGEVAVGVYASVALEHPGVCLTITWGERTTQEYISFPTFVDTYMPNEHVENGRIKYDRELPW